MHYSVRRYYEKYNVFAKEMGDLIKFYLLNDDINPINVNLIIHSVNLMAHALYNTKIIRMCQLPQHIRYFQQILRRCYQMANISLYLK